MVLDKDHLENPERTGSATPWKGKVDRLEKESSSQTPCPNTKSLPVWLRHGGEKRARKLTAVSTAARQRLFPFQSIS